MRKDLIIEKAKEICKQYDVSDYPVKIVELCEKHGISVFEKYLPKEVSGLIVIQKDNYKDFNTGKLIVVNLSDSAARRRFTIAHELGHYILHKGDQEEIYAHRDAGQNGGKEKEANIFASNILMPENLVKNALEDLEQKDSYGQIKISYIAKEFAVSESAALVRLDQLGLI